MKPKRYLILAANITIVLVTLGVVLSVALFQARSRHVPQYQPGEALEFVGELSPKAPRMVLLFLNSSCRYCNASIPFYRRLVSARNHSAVLTTVIAVTAEDATFLQEHLAQQGLRLDGVRQLRKAPTKLSVTPVVLLVDMAGHVLRTWAGRLGQSQEDEVLRSVR